MGVGGEKNQKNPATHTYTHTSPQNSFLLLRNQELELCYKPN